MVNIFNAQEVCLGAITCVIGRRQKNRAENSLCCREDDEKPGDHAIFPRQRVNTSETPLPQDQPSELSD